MAYVLFSLIIGRHWC